MTILASPSSEITELPEVQLTQNASIILKKKYLEDGETAKERYYLLSKTVAQAEKEENREFYTKAFYLMLAEGRGIPNSPAIKNVKLPGNAFFACYVHSPEADSLDGIELGEWTVAKIIKSGGGVGGNFGIIRPEGDTIKGTHKSSCGPLKVIHLRNTTSDTFTQGGSAFREGALMAILPVWHPDIEKFIHAKDAAAQGVRVLSHANMSVAITDAFMQSLEGNSTLSERLNLYEYEGDPKYAFALEFKGKVYRIVDARDIWQQIAESAHLQGDPGCFFVDRVNGIYNPLSSVYTIEATNPCGEIPLPNNSNCNLGHINLLKFIDHETLFRWDSLAENVRLMVRFLDNVIDVSPYPTKETEQMGKGDRRIGLGVLGWADALVSLKIPYASQEALDLAEQVMRFIQEVSDEESLKLGEEKGVYGFWEHSDHKKQGLRYRNAFRRCVAPTGTTSILVGASSGIEPLFSLEWDRITEDGTILKEKANYEGKPDYLQTSMEIAPEWHVRMQAAFQKYVDQSISKTINLPNEATIDDIKAVYQLAYSLGCKGITVYRDGSRKEQVLNNTSSAPKSLAAMESKLDFSRAARVKLPDERQSITHKFSVDGLEGYVTVGLYPDGRPGEIFIHASKQGSTVQGLLDTWASTVSIALQHGVQLNSITDKLIGTRYEPAGFTSNAEIRNTTSIADYISRWLQMRFGSGVPVVPIAISESVPVAVKKSGSGMYCPDCTKELHMAEGCLKCSTSDCGYSRC